MAERFSGRRGLQMLMDAGIIHKGDYVRRVVIDFNVGDAVTMYVERYADTRILQVLTTIDGIEIKTTEDLHAQKKRDTA